MWGHGLRKFVLFGVVTQTRALEVWLLTVGPKAHLKQLVFFGGLTVGPKASLKPYFLG